MLMEAEVGVMHAQTKECQVLLAAEAELEAERESWSPQSP